MGDASTSDQSSRMSGDSLDTLFTALANEQRRQVLQYFQTAANSTASVEELITHTLETGAEDKSHEQLELTFHHITLPKLADLGVIEYDARSQTVRYRGSPVLERALTVMDETADSPERD